ncbi:MAG: adenylate kinase [Candidatus Dojkabacteria bacterium]|nr:MAG: adenylate kinase [Candidatus Dojkabacteria bacterium]GIW61219.1 MAG: adenylate kinase [Patescibacteria group bacterium]
MRYIERYRPKEGEGHNKILVITGVPGSGKDFLLSEAVKQGIIPSSVRMFSFGEELFAYLKTIHPQIQIRDDVRTLLTQDDVWQGVIGVIDKLIQAQPAILNTHVVYRQRESLITNPNVDKRMHPAGYLFVWSEPNQIAEWRARDISRGRPPESIDDIALHQDIALEVVSVVARHTGACLKTVWNRTDNVADNLALIQERARELTP